ncbi:MAG: amidophosphoribosyltransferase [Fimbriiglobus sp.]
MDELKHECGIAALYHFDPAKPSRVYDQPSPVTVNKKIKQEHINVLMPRMLVDLQNRGQLAAGMTSYHPDRPSLLETYKEVGLVSEAFRMGQAEKHEKILEECSGPAVIGHVRYATSGPTSRPYAQPFERKHGSKWKWFAFGFNGNLANLDELREEIESHGYHMTKDNDTEAMMHLMSLELTGPKAPNLVDVFANLAKKFDGSYNIVFLNAMGDMIVLRDPIGLRPVCWSVDGGVFGAASESVALKNLGFKDDQIFNLEPGELIHVYPGGYQRHRFAESPKKAHCFFEWVYFANVASTLDKQSVYISRTKLGYELAAQEEKLKLIPNLHDGNTIICPVPDTAKAAADGMSRALNIPVFEGLMRNRYVGRTFIDAAKRADKVRLKFTPIREVLEGKRVILVEDSIVRSTTLINLLGFIKERGGADEIHVRVACPPIVAPCFYGIDMSRVSELFAPKYMKGNHPTVEEQARMADYFKAASLAYLPVEAIARCIEKRNDQLCEACISGNYPTPHGERLYQLALKKAGEEGGNSRPFGDR